MNASTFISKFHNLPDELKQQVLEFMDVLLSRLKQENGKPVKLPELPLHQDWGTPTVLLPHKGKLLPITPATEKPDIKALAGIWKNKDIDLETLRKKAWGGRL